MQNQEKDRSPLNQEVNRQLTSLTTAVADIRKDIEALAARVVTLEALPRQSAGARLRDDSPSPALMMDEESFWSLIGTSSLLPRLATICFLLVVALMLRVLTDSGTINLHFGSFLGITYALGLIGIGAKMLAANRRLAPVFPV
ncbi:MAG: hypothetical protein OEV91_11075, partial [Desulfobulbaceae bacterium]|nr:hypothetical protein [Desulfobulbaceae bacterium]